jgi:hypothetical protein
MTSLTWNRGLLVANADESRFVQVALGRGTRGRRVLWWPRVSRSVGLRVWGDWWLSLNWRMP